MRHLTTFLLSPLVFLLLIAAASADSGHITLLTVTSEGEAGGTADLYLTVQPGNGAIFIDSFPLTRIDTQSSVRYANRIACDLIQEDCSRYDFFYTIRANSAIVGGPSAGAAITVLTVAVLDNQPIDQDAAMTGTINSGGIIGPVAGVGAKVNGAEHAGITKVLIPSLTAPEEIFGNGTNLSNASLAAQPGLIRELSTDKVSVIGVATVEDALLEFTGKNYSKELEPLAVPQSYTEHMERIAVDICGRSSLLESRIAERGLEYNDTNNYTTRIEQSGSRDYSRASLCFSKNIELSTALLANTSVEERYDLYRQLRVQAQELDNSVRNTTISTISDLETYAIVKERLMEAQQILDEVNATDPDHAQLAYSQERLLSAASWSTFFGIAGEELELDQLHLQRACLAKLAEADERINYVKLYAPSVTLESERLLALAQEHSTTEPVLCIFSASKAKAQANLLANAISVDKSGVDALVSQKLGAAGVVLRKQQEKGFFPILGYSYVQYASDLRTVNPYSALSFSEYALELSNLDIYFPQERGFRFPPQIVEGFLLFTFGTLFGASVVFFILRQKAAAPAARKKR